MEFKKITERKIDSVITHWKRSAFEMPKKLISIIVVRTGFDREDYVLAID